MLLVKTSKHCLVVVYEYGDSFRPEFRKGKYCLSQEEQEVLRLDKFSSTFLDTKEIIIAIHPNLEICSKLVDGLHIDESFQVHFLSMIMRNSSNICEHFKDLGYIIYGNSKLSTVLGYKPELVEGDENDPSYYRKPIDAMTKKANKFICLKDDKFNFSLFEEQLNKREITLFRYDDVEHASDTIKSFIRSESGCLLTNYALARGTECQSLINYQNHSLSACLLRCTINLVNCIPQSRVEVIPTGQEILRIRGSPGDPALYTQLKIELNKAPFNKSNKFVFLFDEKLPPGVEIIKKEYKFPNSKEEVDKHLDSIEQGCITYHHKGTINDPVVLKLVFWLRETSVPLIYSERLPHSVYITLYDLDNHYFKL